jgi:hypothetical protein
MKNSIKFLTLTLAMVVATQASAMSRFFRMGQTAKTTFNNSRLFARSAFANMQNSFKSSNLFRRFATNARPTAFSMTSQMSNRLFAQRALMGCGVMATAINTQKNDQEMNTQKAIAALKQLEKRLTQVDVLIDFLVKEIHLNVLSESYDEEYINRIKSLNDERKTLIGNILNTRRSLNFVEKLAADTEVDVLFDFVISELYRIPRYNYYSKNWKRYVEKLNSLTDTRKNIIENALNARKSAEQLAKDNSKSVCIRMQDSLAKAKAYLTSKTQSSEPFLDRIKSFSGF